jgi:hypothetical protein
VEHAVSCFMQPVADTYEIGCDARLHHTVVLVKSVQWPKYTHPAYLILGHHQIRRMYWISGPFCVGLISWLVDVH